MAGRASPRRGPEVVCVCVRGAAGPRGGGRRVGGVRRHVGGGVGRFVPAGREGEICRGGLAAFDSRVAGVGTTAPGAVDGRFRDSEESEAGRLDTRPPAGFFIIVR